MSTNKKVGSTVYAYRVIEHSKRDGVRGVSADIDSKNEALELAALLRDANPAWVQFSVEEVSLDGSSREVSES
jgi:hypothetical protein